MLTSEQLEAIGVQHGKCAEVRYNGHQIVFRRPTRDHCREYRRMRDSPTEKHDAIEKLAQMCLVAFDGETDANKARTFYTGVFLEEFPMFASFPPVMAALGYLTGMVEEEDAADLGKAVRVWSARRPSTQTESRTGSVTAS